VIVRRPGDLATWRPGDVAMPTPLPNTAPKDASGLGACDGLPLRFGSGLLYADCWQAARARHMSRSGQARHPPSRSRTRPLGTCRQRRRPRVDGSRLVHGEQHWLGGSAAHGRPLAGDHGSLYVSDGAVLFRVYPRTGRVLARRTDLGARAESGCDLGWCLVD